jgi:hypothetical protein
MRARASTEDGPGEMRRLEGGADQPIGRHRNWLPGVEAIGQGDSFGELGTLLAGAIQHYRSAANAHMCLRETVRKCKRRFELVSADFGEMTACPIATPIANMSPIGAFP